MVVSMKTLLSFNKTFCELNPETWNIQEFSHAIEQFLPQFFGRLNFCIYYTQHSDTSFMYCCKEGKPPLETDEAVKISNTNRDFTIIQNGKDDAAFFLLPFFSRKKPVMIIIMYGKKKKIQEHHTKAAELYIFIKDHFTRFKHAKKKFIQLENDIQSRRFDSLRKFLSTRKTVNRKYFQKYIINPCSERLVLTDFANVYKPSKDKTIFCLSDITCNSEIRFEALTLIDAALTILSRTDIPFSKYLPVLDASLKEKLAACYLSIACILYDEKENSIEISGAGSCTCLLYKHDSAGIKKILFKDPLGTPKQECPDIVKMNVGAGDVLLVCSDGMLENKKTSGSEYGIEFIYNTFQKNINLPIIDQAEILEKSYIEILDEEEIFDDTTFLMYKFE